MSEVRMESGMENADDEGAAPASQEEQDHEAGERGGDGAFAQHAINGGAHKERLIEELAARRGLVEGRRARCGSASLTALTMSSVDALPFFRMVSSAERRAIGAHDVGLHRDSHRAPGRRPA